MHQRALEELRLYWNMQLADQLIAAAGRPIAAASIAAGRCTRPLAAGTLASGALMLIRCAGILVSPRSDPGC
jgi:hypothetical protein